MKKRLVYAIFMFIIIVGAFLTGFWYSSHKGGKTGVSIVEPSPDVSEVEMEKVSPPETPGTVHISPKRQQTIGVRVGLVEKKPFEHTIRVLGRVEADEVRVYRIVASVDGWIQNAYDNSVGTLVKKGEILATFYSAQFLDAEQAYIYALDAVDRLKSDRRLELGRKELPAQIAVDQLSVQRQIDLLRSMGMGDSQLEEIGQTRLLQLDVRITAPTDGFVTARYVSPGQRFIKGTELYQITDLSRVWILADVYEHEVQYFKPGLEATARLPYQDRTYKARVSRVLPVFDAESRTLKIRLEAGNPGFVLRPYMFADVELPIKLEPTMTVPADAILYAGLRKTVFVDHGNGYFEPRQVETGWRLGDQVEILEGLEPGERIVLSGNFLVDSESRLQAVALGIYGESAIDPVCGMEVDEAKARATGLTSAYRGKTYYFCSKECKEQFDEDPGQFVVQPDTEKKGLDSST